jgi:hypothetical protein
MTGMDAAGCPGVDLQSDPAHCGRCDRVCPTTPNGVVACVAGVCGFTCVPGFVDCDGLPGNGCERDVEAAGMCNKGCGAPCVLPNATAECVSGACAIVTCDAGWDDCDGMAATGCERALGTASDCGGCDDACGGEQICEAGVCGACPARCACTDTCGTGGDACDCAAGCGCTFECEGEGCDVRCSGAETKCIVDGLDRNSSMFVECRDRADCFFDGRGQSNVRGRCTGVGTTCEFDCRPGVTDETSNCHEVECLDGAECRIQCGSTTNCDFEQCHADLVRSCAGWVTCGTDTCP